LTAALGAVNPTKNVIKLDDAGPYIPNLAAPNFTVSTDVTIDARGATLHKNMDGPILTIADGKTATLFGGKLEGATGTTGDGILCGVGATLTIDGATIQTIDKSAINTLSGCRLTVTNAAITTSSMRSGVFVAAILSNGDSVTLSRSRLLMNRGGGINVFTGTFVIVGNVFLSNGDPNSPNGAILINTAPDMADRVEFNSISGNHAMLGANEPGVRCTAGPGSIARNNIIWGNNDNNGPQIGGSCKHAYSDIGMMSVSGINDGGNNLSIDPMFTSMSDLHLMPGSIVLKKADPNATLDGRAAEDIDGNQRIAPADLGAYQLSR